VSETGELDAAERAYSEDAQAKELPAVDFLNLVVSMSHSALLHLGDAPDPATGARDKNLPLARQTIDLLAMLQEKTHGNLTGDEERVLTQAIYDLRMRFVEVAQGK
jgi:Domain of unknown function (DUF1844)